MSGVRAEFIERAIDKLRRNAEVLDTGVEDKSLKLDGTTLSWVRSDGEQRSATVP